MSKPIIQSCLELLSHTSLRFQYRLADLLAFFVSRTSNQLSKQARQNLAICFGDLDAAERQRLYHATIRQTCYAMTELAAVWCWPADRVLRQITSVNICPEFEQSTRGRIILAPHLGSWETLAIWLGRHYSAIFLYKRRKNKLLDNFVRDSRARSGGVPVPTKKRGLRKLLIGLKQGGSLMILPDQKPSPNKVRIESEFFGVRAPTTSLVQNLCSKVECDVFIASIYRSSPPGEFNLNIQPLDYQRLAGDEVSSVQYMNDQIEALARAQLTQYQWGYRRFSNSAYSTDKQGMR